MKTTHAHTPPMTYRDLNPRVRARELASFAAELKRGGPITAPRLNRWVGESVARKNLLSGLVWGTIRWPKSRGRPKTASLTGAFELEHDYLAEKFRVTQGGGIEEISTWEKQMPPSMRDDSNESEYRVTYHFFAVYFWPNRLTFRMRNVEWEKPLILPHGYRRLDPPEFRPFRNLGEFVILPDIEVKYVSWIQAGIRVIRGRPPFADENSFPQAARRRRAG